MPSLHDLIAELRREHPTPAANRALDMVVAELGQTKDNLKRALARLDGKPVPTGGKAVLEELAVRARAAGVDDYEVPLSPDQRRAVLEPVDSSQIGIALMLALSTVVPIALAAVAIATAVSSLH